MGLSELSGLEMFDLKRDGAISEVLVLDCPSRQPKLSGVHGEDLPDNFSNMFRRLCELALQRWQVNVRIS